MTADDDWPQREKDYLMAIATMGVPAHLRAKFDIEDVVQDAWLKVHQNNEALQGRSTGERRAYLKTALASALADRIRHFDVQGRRAARERSLEAALDDSSARLEQFLAADQTSPSQRVSREEQLLRLVTALTSLPVDQRAAVHLHHLQRLSISETAETMNRSNDAVAGLLRRGMKTLRDRLKERERTGS